MIWDGNVLDREIDDDSMLNKMTMNRLDKVPNIWISR